MLTRQRCSCFRNGAVGGGSGGEVAVDSPELRSGILISTARTVFIETKLATSSF